MHEIKNIAITPQILKLIAEIDEFKGRWTVIETLAPEKLTTETPSSTFRPGRRISVARSHPQRGSSGPY